MNRKSTIAAALVAAIALSNVAEAARGRDYISIVGSSTVYPFSTVVAEHLGKTGKLKTPKVESTGTGGGIKLFCGGVGIQYPDIANASRAIRKTELENCLKAGVKDIVEVKIGYDGIVVAQSRKSKDHLELTLKEIYLALAKRVPDPAKPDGEVLVENPYKTWNEINPKFPKTKIEVLGPPPTSGTRDSFHELFLEKGAEAFDSLKALKKKDEEAKTKDFEKVWKSIRKDGAYVEAGENDNVIVQKLEGNKNAYGIFGFSFLEENADKLKGVSIEGADPTFENISGGKYKGARPLFVYFKKAHFGVIPGLDKFLAEYVSEKALGADGYLTDKGLVALPKEEFEKSAKAATDLVTLKAEDLK